jgi:putative glutamine amidotransferase
MILTVAHPTKKNIQALVALHNEGLFPDTPLLVVGVYHSDEQIRYIQSSDSLVKSDQIEWFRFHRIEEPINKDSLFQNNLCTPAFQTIFNASHGLIFFGGDDIPPALYRRKTSLLTSIQTPVRSYFELSFLFHLLGGYQDDAYIPLLEQRPSLPILGICLGCQSLSVGAGGTLIQDIWSEKYSKHNFEDVLALGNGNWHRNPFKKLHPEKELFHYSLHRIQFQSPSLFIEELEFQINDRPLIISGHHQAIEELGKDLQITATSLDGQIIEAIEHQRFPHVLGVQFHPEKTIIWDQNQSIQLSPDEEPYNIRSYLEKQPPSFEFHRRIWIWFFQKMEEFYHTQPDGN